MNAADRTATATASTSILSLVRSFDRLPLATRQPPQRTAAMASCVSGLRVEACLPPPRACDSINTQFPNNRFAPSIHRHHRARGGQRAAAVDMRWSLSAATARQGVLLLVCLLGVRTSPPDSQSFKAHDMPVLVIVFNTTCIDSTHTGGKAGGSLFAAATTAWRRRAHFLAGRQTRTVEGTASIDNAERAAPVPGSNRHSRCGLRRCWGIGHWRTAAEAAKDIPWVSD